MASPINFLQVRGQKPTFFLYFLYAKVKKLNNPLRFLYFLKRIRKKSGKVGREFAAATPPLLWRDNNTLEGFIMGTFMKDYNELLVKPQKEFLSKHWKGYTAIVVASGIVGYGYGYVKEHGDVIKNKIQAKGKKKSKGEA